MNKTINMLLATTLLGASSVASAVTIVFDATNTDSIPGVATFTTTGAMMDGMSVTAVFGGSLTETIAWADTGVSSGGVSGTGWSLNLSGNTFGANWNFSNNTNFGLTQLVLDGSTGLTLFDIDTDATDPTGTPGSARGITFSDTPSVAITATYSDQVQVGANAAVGDIWHKLTIDFLGATGGGATGNFSFVQDTDNDIRATVPAPAVLGLLGFGLIGIGAARRLRA